MKKRYFIGSTLVIALCAIVLCAFADQERTDASEAVVSERPYQLLFPVPGAKFSWLIFPCPKPMAWMLLRGKPTGIGRKVARNTEYVATVIREATGGDLFEIKTVHTYPGTHKELIDAAKRNGRGCPSCIGYPHQESERVRCRVRRVSQLVVRYAPAALYVF